MKYKVLIAVVGMTFMFGCEPTQEEIAKQKEEEVVAIHDEAMAKMEKIQTTVHALEKLKHTYMVDSLNHAHHLAKMEDCDLAIADLHAADKAMMDWMHEYKLPGKEVSDDEKIKFYDLEKEKIEKVNGQIEVGIHEGMHFVRRFYDDLADEQKEAKQHKDELKKEEEITDSTSDLDVEV